MATGAMEAHDKHLPLSTDSLLPTHQAEKVAEKINALVLLTIPFGDSWSFDIFEGTISIAPDVLVQFCSSVMDAVFKMDFDTSLY